MSTSTLQIVTQIPLPALLLLIVCATLITLFALYLFGWKRDVREAVLEIVSRLYPTPTRQKQQTTEEEKTGAGNGE